METLKQTRVLYLEDVLQAALLKGKTDWLSLTRLGNSLNFLTPKLAIANLKV